MNRETKQTAVEWLAEQISDYLQENYNIDYFDSKIIEQAKEMEKQQIMNAFSIGEIMATDYFYGEDNCAINYYNETYGGNK
jgi:purine-nucleoside phosphorylase